MKSIVLWCNKKNKDKVVSADVHFNLWKLRKRKKLLRYRDKYKYFLDIGVMVHEIQEVNCIRIYFPFELKENDVKDLGSTIRQNKNLINGIFNEDYRVLHDSIPKQTKVINNCNSDEPEFIIYSIEKCTEISDKYNGSILTINVKNIKCDDCKKFYLRFRISADGLVKLTKQYQPKNWFFQHALTCTELIDFRLNEKRTYDETLSEEIMNDGEFELKKIHFLLLRYESDDFESIGINASCRELEQQLWNEYIGNEYVNENIVAYHWKEKAKENDKIDSFNTLIKLKILKSNFKTIFVYLLVLSVITICLNLLANVIQTELKLDTSSPSIESIKIDKK